MGQQYTYEYVFEKDTQEIIAHVSYAFGEISDLETISVFPHRERREFAIALMNKYCADQYHKLDATDIACPFAVQLNELFEGNLKVYWTSKFRVTMLFYTGFILQ